MLITTYTVDSDMLSKRVSSPDCLETLFLFSCIGLGSVSTLYVSSWLCIEFSCLVVCHVSGLCLCQA